MMSNNEAAEIAKNTGIGFSIGDDTGITYDDMKNRIMGELKKLFRPEFLNRIDEVIVFHKLTREEIKEIVELLLRRIRQSMADRELSLNLSDDAKNLLVEKGWDPAMGARPLRRAIQRYIEDPLADEVLRASEMEPGSTVEIDREPNAPEDAPEVKISILPPPAQRKKREPVCVGAKSAEEGSGDGDAEGGSLPEGSAGVGLQDEPAVIPAV